MAEQATTRAEEGKDTSEHFEIDASVVFQLGESLITDSIQALMELVKNSYDADASFCRVTISTAPITDEHSPFNGAEGLITIEDDGTGMTLEAIRSGWLTISNSGKRQMKRQSATTQKGRTPLGDKGLGRLGTQRLGQNLEMTTRIAGAPTQQHVWFSWKQFEGERVLSDVVVSRKEEPPVLRRGTRLTISSLRDLKTWVEDTADLETRLSQMISPYDEARDFNVYASVNGVDLEFASISSQLRDTAQIRYSLSFNGSLLSIKGAARTSYLRSEAAATPEERAEFKTLVEDDNGEAFYEYLSGKKNAKDYHLDRKSEVGWFASFGTTIELSSMDKKAFVGDIVANPGRFNGAVDFFSLSNEAGGEQNLYTTQEYRKTIERLSGIKVYRDGFGIPVSSDWLGLGKQWTKAKSYYTLKPQNTLGYIALSAKENGHLQEKTDREGFTDSPYYRNFLELMTHFVTFSGNAQQFLRRGYLSFRGTRIKAGAQIAPEVTPEQISKDLGLFLSKAATHKSSVQQSALRLTHAVQQADEAIACVSDGSDSNLEQLKALAASLREESEQAARVMVDAQSYLEAAVSQSPRGNILASQIADLREQIDQVYEVIGLGLTAEALSHEVNNVLMQLSERTKTASRNLRNAGSKDTRLFTYLEYVESAIAALRRQMIFLEPSLRYAREKREVFSVTDLATELQQHYVMHFINSPVYLSVNAKVSSTPFRVKINKGKLIQVLDNLVINSEYWIKEQVRSGASRGTITIDLQAPFIRITDSGPGIDPAVENTLFEPFISTKGKGRGRGLGLYVAQQLLRAEGCNIRLTGHRNTAGRHDQFEIDLSGVVTNER